MNNRHLYWLAGMLTVIGLAAFLYKTQVLGFPVSPGVTTDVWDVEMRLRFRAPGGPVKASMYIPVDIHPYMIVDENFVSRGYGLATTRHGDNRHAVWSIRRAAGQQTLYYRAMIQRVEVKDSRPVQVSPPVAELSLSESQLDAANALLAEVRTRSADLDTLIAQLMQRLVQPGHDTNAALLVGKQADAGKRIDTAIQVLALAGIPARLVHGVELSEGEDAGIVPWLQVFGSDRKWQYYHPETGEAGQPENYLVLWRGTDTQVSLEGGSRPAVRISVSRTEQAGMQAAAIRTGIVNPHLMQFSLFSLPVQTQEVYRVLLLIPVGTLLLVIFRNVIGIKTFGTFMPVLMALAFRETLLLSGIVLFSLIVALGLGIRFYLERLKLLLVPRLATVLIMVVLIMALISIVSHQLGFELGLSIALFPMVILTMTIERMSIVWEERGPAEAIQQGLGSLVVAAFAYLAISQDEVGHLVFVFPELLLVILAITLLLGRYTGYRLLELRRFRQLAGSGS